MAVNPSTYLRGRPARPCRPPAAHQCCSSTPLYGPRLCTAAPPIPYSVVVVVDRLEYGSDTSAHLIDTTVPLSINVQYTVQYKFIYTVYVYNHIQTHHPDREIAQRLHGCNNIPITGLPVSGDHQAGFLTGGSQLPLHRRDFLDDLPNMPAKWCSSSRGVF